MHAKTLFERSFAAFLFDMDGTILNSIAVANRVWDDWARRHHLDVDVVLAAMHGVQVLETVSRFAPPGVDRQVEAEAITLAEMEDVEGIVEIPGAGRILGALPPDRWAVVTSAPRRLALRRMAAAGLAIPRVLVGAEDVPAGKPAPDCFLAAADRLGVQPGDCLVFEDSPAGVAAAQAAGMEVVVVEGAHAMKLFSDLLRIADYRELDLLNDGRSLSLSR